MKQYLLKDMEKLATDEEVKVMCQLMWDTVSIEEKQEAISIFFQKCEKIKELESQIKELKQCLMYK